MRGVYIGVNTASGVWGLALHVTQEENSPLYVSTILLVATINSTAIAQVDNIVDFGFNELKVARSVVLIAEAMCIALSKHRCGCWWHSETTDQLTDLRLRQIDLECSLAFSLPLRSLRNSELEWDENL